jgi:hypothetical protein
MNSHLHFGRFAFDRRALEYFQVDRNSRRYMDLKAGYVKKDGDGSAGPRGCVVDKGLRANSL